VFRAQRCPRRHDAARAHRTYGPTLRHFRDDRLPLVRRVASASPPDLVVARRADGVGSARSVLGGVPECGDVRMPRCERPGSAVESETRAERAAGSERFRPGLNRRAPLVCGVARALPPHTAIASDHDIARANGCVADPVPLRRKLGSQRGERVRHRRLLVRAERTPGSRAPTAGRSTPLVIGGSRTLPPHARPAMDGDTGRLERSVLARVPLRRKCGTIGNGSHGVAEGTPAAACARSFGRTPGGSPPRGGREWHSPSGTPTAPW